MAINIGLFHVGEAIKDRMRSLKMSQEDFAKKYEKTQPTINALLRKSSMDTDKLKEISILLDYNFFEDFCPDLKQKKEEQIAHEETENENQTIKELIKQMSYLRNENEKLHAIIDTFTSIRNKEASDSKKIANQ